MNPFFYFPSSLSRFVKGTLARAQDVNTRFDEVSTGFDGVKTELDLKAPIASPTFTGTVAVPSPGSVSDDSTKPATTAWVQDVIGANSTLLPTQTGKANKVLRTDGTSASWETPYPRYPIFSAEAATATPVSNGEDLAYGRTFTTGLSSGTHSIRYSNSLFLASTSAVTDKIATSPDGEVWTLRTMPSSATWRIATDGTNSLATAALSTAVAISTNGTTWTSATALGGALASTVTYPAVIGTTWLAGSNSTTVYTSGNFGTSWAAQTLPNNPALGGGFFVVNGRFWYWASGTTAYHSTTGATGSWTSSTLPITPVRCWVNPDGTVCFTATADGSPVYECTSYDTYSLVSGVTTSGSNGIVSKVNGVWATFDVTFGESRSYHLTGSIPRTSSVAVADSVAAKSATAFVLPGVGTSVITITTTAGPTALFEV